MAEGKRGLGSANPETRARVSKAGGNAISQNKNHMAEIGKKGGKAISQNHEYMAMIGRKGGQAPHKNRGKADPTPSQTATEQTVQTNVQQSTVPGTGTKNET